MTSISDSQVPDEGTVRRIAETVRIRREMLNLDQDLARHGGPSRTTVGALENKNIWPLRQRTRSAWATALGWEPDAFELLVQGERPKRVAREAAEAAQPPTTPLLDVLNQLRDLADECIRIIQQQDGSSRS